jgi:hypothetical protein
MTDFHKFLKEKIIHRLTQIFDDYAESEDTDCSEASTTTFKKIQMLFHTVADLIKYLILQVDNPKYQNVESEKIKFIKSEEDLVLIMGCYGDAFDREIEETMFRMINLPFYVDFMNIANINLHMMPFVAGVDIDIKKLNSDYEKFSDVVRNFTCDALGVNSDFNTDFLIDEAEVPELQTNE